MKRTVQTVGIIFRQWEPEPITKAPSLIEQSALTDKPEAVVAESTAKTTDSDK